MRVGHELRRALTGRATRVHGKSVYCRACLPLSKEQRPVSEAHIIVSMACDASRI